MSASIITTPTKFRAFTRTSSTSIRCKPSAKRVEGPESSRLRSASPRQGVEGLTPNSHVLYKTPDIRDSAAARHQRAGVCSRAPRAGRPFDRERAPASPEIERHLKAKYHLDEPVWKQYSRYLGDLAHGDFGVSLKYRNHTVNDIIAQGLPVSMTLGSLALCFAMGVGLPLGFFTAARRGRWEDYTGSFLAMLVVCVPGFVVAPLLILGFSIKWNLLPVALWESPWHAILPTIALGLFFAGKVARLMREGMLNAMQSEFVTAARSKGLGENSL